MSKSKLIIANLISVTLFLISCEYAHFNNLLSKTNSCDSLNVTYSKSVKKILVNNCYGCHSTAITSSTNGFDLEDFSSLKNYLTLSFNNDGVYGSRFSHTIHQQGYLLYMPPTYKLTKCELSIIDKWIKAGAPEN